MKYQISANQHHFFQKHHWITFEEVVSDVEQKKLVDAVKKRALYADLCSNIQEVRDVLFLPRLSTIAVQLCHKAPLRYGFDELFCEKSVNQGFTMLSDERALSGLEIAMMLCIEGNCTAEFVSKKGIDIFPKNEREALFFTPSSICDPLALMHHRGQTFLLFTWANRGAMYLYNLKDPNVHALKKQGYVFGDKVKEKTHPILCRKLM